MKIKAASFISVILINTVTWAQVDVQSYLAPLVSRSLLLDIAQSDSQLIAVGERGHVLLSKNSQDWLQVVVPSLATLTAVDFNGNKGWAVGHDTTILMTNDGGVSWSLQYYAPQIERPLLDVHFFDAQHGITVGAYGTFLRTQDGGVNWVSEMHSEFLSQDDLDYLKEIRVEDEAFYLEELASILPHLNSVSQSGERLYLAGEAGLLAISDDMGHTWQRMDIDYYGSFFDFTKTDSGRIFAVGLRGHLFELDHDEQKWSAINSGSTSSLNAIISIDEKNSIIVGNNGAQVRISDTQVTYAQSEDGKAILKGFFQDGQVLAVTEIGIKYIQKDL
ncbi:MAG: photosystem II stability/assembly factor-like uncharacterized protein [Congregibacter sp.]|jgi:photosystem II stability/assembly factor-like uncharacterized protein